MNKRYIAFTIRVSNEETPSPVGGIIAVLDQTGTQYEYLNESTEYGSQVIHLEAGATAPPELFQFAESFVILYGTPKLWDINTDEPINSENYTTVAWTDMTVVPPEPEDDI